MFTGTLSVDAEVVTHGYLSLARLQQARGRHADAQATLEEFADLARQRDFFPLLVARGEAARARLALIQDDLPAAVSWAEASGLGADDEPSYPREEQYLTLVRVLIAQGRLDSDGLLPRRCAGFARSAVWGSGGRGADGKRHRDPGPARAGPAGATRIE